MVIFRKQSSDVYEDIEELSRIGTANVLISQGRLGEIRNGMECFYLIVILI